MARGRPLGRTARARLAQTGGRQRAAKCAGRGTRAALRLLDGPAPLSSATRDALVGSAARGRARALRAPGLGVPATRAGECLEPPSGARRAGPPGGANSGRHAGSFERPMPRRESTPSHVCDGMIRRAMHEYLVSSDRASDAPAVAFAPSRPRPRASPDRARARAQDPGGRGRLLDPVLPAGVTRTRNRASGSRERALCAGSVRRRQKCKVCATRCTRRETTTRAKESGRSVFGREGAQVARGGGREKDF